MEGKNGDAVCNQISSMGKLIVADNSNLPQHHQSIFGVGLNEVDFQNQVALK
jgi:hypothetical protein